MSRKTIGPGALVVVLALLVAAWAVPAGAEDEGPLSTAELGQALAKAKVKMGDAAKTAEARVKGTAFAAELEVEDGVVLYDVYVFVPGTPPRIFEVEVNAETGKVMDVEEEGPDDDGDDDDDDDDEDDD